MYTEESSGEIYIEKQIRVPTYSMSYEHSHSYYELFYLKTGQCIYSLNNYLYHLTAGDMFIVVPGELHSTQYEGSEPCERIIIYCKLNSIPEDFLLRYSAIREQLTHSGKIIFSKKGSVQLDKLISRMLFENGQPDDYSSGFLTLQTMELLLNIRRNGIWIDEPFKQNDNTSTDIDDAIKYIAVNYQLPLTLSEVAANVSLSPTYLSKKFKKITGYTFKEYVNYIRITQACQALLTTDDSITKIALNSGFSSSNYFKDLFRKINGMSPRTFRQQAANKIYKK